ncbi:unnamed protein product [Vitrella brassicaformis CCMP3155]|uniref:Uncharacterized protein n=1 Tax=Vitrella brassicaformis (strain CCMP3155) TaxID=1169540 RepID=A0A0G4FAL7_VITBC|nr:unnamed protein product [Vitrella brassicaformis CCMP3155]|eukprot:CEM09647.1 unnamed protein product [Vitrella brassicaformis CCMP3155]
MIGGRAGLSKSEETAGGAAHDNTQAAGPQAKGLRFPDIHGRASAIAGKADNTKEEKDKTTAGSQAVSGQTVSSIKSNPQSGHSPSQSHTVSPPQSMGPKSVYSERMRVIAMLDYLKAKLKGMGCNADGPTVCFNFAELCREYLFRMQELTAGENTDSMPSGEPLREYLEAFNFGRVSGRLMVFLRRYHIHQEDVQAVMVTTLCYIKSMETPTLLPLLKQMVLWFDANNVVYFLSFLAHIFVLDDTVPLKYWGEILGEGVAKGTNVNKCVRNLLKMRKYRLDVDRATFDGIHKQLQNKPQILLQS